MLSPQRISEPDENEILDDNQDLSKTIVQLSSARSGSTLLANVINYSGSLRMMFEPMYHDIQGISQYSFVYKKVYEMAVETQLDFLPFLTGKVHHPWSDRFTSPGIYENRIFKEIRANLLAAWLKKTFPAISLVFLIRHPLAVCASKLAMPFKVASVHLPKLEKDFPEISSIAAMLSDEDWDQYVFDWCVENYVPLKLLNPDDYHLVFFEDLFLQPQTTLSKLFTFLGRDYRENEVLEAVRKPSQTSGLNPNTKQVEESYLPAHWEKQLTKEQIKRAGDILSLFGMNKLYHKDGPPNHQFVKYFCNFT